MRNPCCGEALDLNYSGKLSLCFHGYTSGNYLLPGWISRFSSGSQKANCDGSREVLAEGPDPDYVRFQIDVCTYTLSTSFTSLTPIYSTGKIIYTQYLPKSPRKTKVIRRYINRVLFGVQKVSSKQPVILSLSSGIRLSTSGVRKPEYRS